MDFIQIFFGTLAAYFIGSIPTTVIVSKFYFGIDIRDHGSGAASHINAQRILGWKPSLIMRIIDIAKGLLAAEMAIFLLHSYGPTNAEQHMLMMSFGLAAVMGHIFPLFAKLRGGKGIHCAIGVLLALNPVATIACAAIGLLVFLISRYPNLAYVTGSFFLPVFVYFSRGKLGEETVPTLIFSIILFSILFFAHLSNIRDILNGDELKVDWNNLR